MKRLIKSAIRPLLRNLGARTYPPDFSEQHQRICDTVAPFTMTSPERVQALINAVQYVVANNIEGAMVECGVWRGGSAMAMALTLSDLGIQDRDLYLYDTFSGMSAPSDLDVSIRGVTAHEKFTKTKLSDNSSNWCLSPSHEVKENVLSTGYPEARLHLVKGKVEDTIPGTVPKQIALLRLDTDWYESTKHELIHLFPLLTPNGVLIIDDYGDWQGARKAVDEFIAGNRIPILLNRIDYTGRIGVKTA